MGSQSKNKKGLIADINVTPFVDVMLVLLVIFMVTAPLMLNGIKLSLPKTKEVNALNLTSKQVILSFTKSGSYFLGSEKLSRKEVLREIKTKFSKHKTNVLYLRADYDLQYGSVAKLMSFLKRGGVHHIALVTQKED